MSVNSFIPPQSQPNDRNPHRDQRHPYRKVFKYAFLAIALILIASALWLISRAVLINDAFQEVNKTVPVLRQHIQAELSGTSFEMLDPLRRNVSAASSAANDPVWKTAAAIPFLGENFAAVTEATTSVNEVVEGALVPLLADPAVLQLDQMAPTHGTLDMRPLQAAATQLRSAANVLRLSHERLASINTSTLLPAIADRLSKAEEQLQPASKSLNMVADVANLAPSMAGYGGERRYLLMIQNNAESRASGGIPGALAVLTFDEGKATLDAHSSAGAIGAISPPLQVDLEQRQIFTTRISKFMQDVNLTPDFPTAASTAHAMWQKKTGQRLDGVISVDPVVLGYLLDATGPVYLTNPELVALAHTGLPTRLDAQNVVPTLLADVYAEIQEPRLQDAYFAGVAKEIFTALSDGQGEGKGLLRGLTRGTEEGRVLLWSRSAVEQTVLVKYPLAGSISGPSIPPAHFGVYFNDGTGAKMDYYVRRTVQLVRTCASSGYRQVKVRVSSTNTAPRDAAISLPKYVTGDGNFGVAPGTVQTNIVAYGPGQAHVENALADNKRIDFASQLHSGRPVGIVTVVLPPGKSSTIEFTFGKIIQDAEPTLTVTPTVQPLKDVVLSTISETCVPAP